MKYSLIVLAALVAACVATPHKPVVLSDVVTGADSLRYVTDARGSGELMSLHASAAEYGDDRFTPAPIAYLDQRIGQELAHALRGNKVAITVFTVTEAYSSDTRQIGTVVGVSGGAKVLAGVDAGEQERQLHCRISGRMGDQAVYGLAQAPVQRQIEPALNGLVQTCVSDFLGRLETALKAVP